MNVKTNVIKISQELHSALKIQAINERIQLQELTKRILQDYLDKHKPTS